MDGNMCEGERKKITGFLPPSPPPQREPVEIVDPGLWPSGQDASGRHWRV